MVDSVVSQSKQSNICVPSPAPEVLAAATMKPWLAQCVSAAEWRKTIDRLLDMYRAIDVGSVEATGLATDALTPRLVQARLRWELHDRAARPLYEFDAMYTLARHTETFRITAIAHNEIPQYRSCLKRVRS